MDTPLSDSSNQHLSVWKHDDQLRPLIYNDHDSTVGQCSRLFLGTNTTRGGREVVDIPNHNTICRLCEHTLRLETFSRALRSSTMSSRKGPIAALLNNSWYLGQALTATENGIVGRNASPHVSYNLLYNQLNTTNSEQISLCAGLESPSHSCTRSSPRMTMVVSGVPGSMFSDVTVILT